MQGLRFPIETLGLGATIITVKSAPPVPDLKRSILGSVFCLSWAQLGANVSPTPPYLVRPAVMSVIKVKVVGTGRLCIILNCN